MVKTKEQLTSAMTVFTHIHVHLI